MDSGARAQGALVSGRKAKMKRAAARAASSALMEQSKKYLAVRGISPADAKLLGLTSSNEFGIENLKIPYWGIDGKRIPFHRRRILGPPSKKGGGKSPKFVQPAGSRPHAYLSPRIKWLEIAKNSDVEIVLTEGEMKAASACCREILTIGIGGVDYWGVNGKQLPELEAFKWNGRVVVVAFDSDVATNINVRRAERKLARELRKRGANVFRVKLPPGPEGANTGLDDFLAPMDAQSAAKAFSELPREPIEPVEEHTDTGNGRRLIRFFGDSIVYVKGWGFFVLNPSSKVWEPDVDGLRMAGLAKESAASWSDDVELAHDPKQKDKIRDWAKRSESMAAIRAAIEAARSEPDVAIDQSSLDADTKLLPLTNGVVDLRTGKLRSLRASDYVTQCAGTKFDRSAKCPKFLSFLTKILCGDRKLIAYLQRCFGYFLTADNSEQVIFFFHGSGSNGKSVLLNIAIKLLGDFAATADLDSFLAGNEGRIRNDLARLKGKRVVGVVEADSGQRLSTSLLKRFSGGDYITARKLYREHIEFRPEGKLVFLVNQLPVARDDSEGLWRRVRVIPFNYWVQKKDENKNLTEELYDELPGILNWALAGLAAFRKSGLGECTAVTEASLRYRKASDQIDTWMTDDCTAGENAVSRLDGLYRTYQNWCEKNCEHALSKRIFADRLRGRGLDVRETTVKDLGGKGTFVFGLTQNANNSIWMRN